MVKIRLSPEKFAKKLKRVTAGDEIILKEGCYVKPIIFNGLIGTEDQPIIIRRRRNANLEDVIITSGIDFEEARLRGNLIAQRREKSGLYPTVGHLGDQAMMVFRNCQFVIIENLCFKDCWPTAIYFDQCHYMAVNNVYFRGGTLAIGASGPDTHDIIVQNCDWQQDTSEEHNMWNHIAWSRIHGAKNNSPSGVDVKDDFRLWDGDFFRSWGIAGNVIIRKNLIKDAFNGVHSFNKRDQLAPGVDANSFEFNGGRQYAANFLIEDNTFVRVRDNIFEPEDYAWNWVMRGNHMQDCYRPFSFELKRAGFFYVYNNTASFVNAPSTKLRQIDQAYPTRSTPSLTKPKGTQKNEGPIYMFNNSWHMKIGKGILPKFGIGKLVHKNNAIEFGSEKKARMFGAIGSEESTRPLSSEGEKVSESSRFTRRWVDFQIEMNGDVTNDANYPEKYQYLGYRISDKAMRANPNFVDPINGDFTTTGEETLGKSVELELKLPDDSVTKIQAGNNVGAVQQWDLYRQVDSIFKFLPDTGWLDRIVGTDDDACDAQIG